MLYNLSWLEPGQMFPPQSEVDRLTRYLQNAALFNGDHFGDPVLRSRDGITELPIDVFMKSAERISQVIGNFEEVISFPTLLNYQRLMSLKMADLVCGEYPTISGVSSEDNAAIKQARDYTDFDGKLYSTVLDISRYGDSIWRLYYDDGESKDTFTCWTPTQWFPVVAQDGTNSIKQHCLVWREDKNADPDNPDWRLHVQIHGTAADEIGYYEKREYQMHNDGHTIKKLVSSTKVPTGLDRCAVFHLKAYTVTGSVYGYDDYMNIDSIMAEIMARVGQISAILDKHADPNITGPVSMLQLNEKTGEYYLKTGKFFAVSPGEEQPKYMTWDGQLTSAFKQLEFLTNQLYILSEMGAALLGGQDSSGTAISGTAMRFKMVNPLAKARRIANSMTRSVRYLFSSLSNVPVENISVFWSDGLPDDPRENIENCKLATGETKMMPLETAIMEFFGRSNEEALKWIDKIHAEVQANIQNTEGANSDGTNSEDDPNKPGPQDGTGVNPARKGSTTGLNDFHGLQND